jgi:hypothetical protein
MLSDLLYIAHYASVYITKFSITTTIFLSQLNKGNLIGSQKAGFEERSHGK